MTAPEVIEATVTPASESAYGEAALQDLAERVRAARGVAHKRDIADVVARLSGQGRGSGGAAGHAEVAMANAANARVRAPSAASAATVPIGDDCAAIPDGDGYLLFAIEGFVKDFVEAEPYFAGYCGVMVNVSDIFAMGGRPIAVVDALWSRGGDAADPILDGLARGAQVYGVPIVGGHSNRRCQDEQLAVAIMGRARCLLSSFAARAGEHLVAVIDLRGAFHEPFPYWDASSTAPAERLRGDLEILPTLAERGLCRAAKDISMAGIVGTALMFAECSGVGLRIDAERIPKPRGVSLARWLDIFPSYGFLLAVDDAALPAVLGAFAARDLPAASIGRFDDSLKVRLGSGGAARAASHEAGRAMDAPNDAPSDALVWDFRETALIGCGTGAAQGGMP